MSHDPGLRSWSTKPPVSRDRRVLELTERTLSHGLHDQARKQITADPYRSLGLEQLAHDQRRPLYTGMVVYALPYANWYKVQIDGTGASIGCTLGAPAGFIAFGPRPIQTLPARSNVVLWVPPGCPYGIILAAFPTPHHDGRLIVPDWIAQGSQAGAKREAAYLQPFKSLYREGGIRDFSANRPIDSTTLDWGMCTETGLMLSLDPFMLQARVNEMCGIWMHYWDSHLRLAALNLDLWTAAHEIVARDDEGECHYVESRYTYPWEAAGLYTPGSPIGVPFDPTKVQFEIAKGAVDLPDGKEDVLPFARYREFGGYLGQGHLRMVAAPGVATGIRRYADDPRQLPDLGVFCESIGLDGSYALHSAKQLYIGKRVLIPVPKEMRRAEDQKIGDDARQQNYNFSGVFGSSNGPHHVGDVDTSAEAGRDNLLRVAGIDDLIAYACNWKAVHPFHYHANDYKLPEESDLASSKLGVTRLQDRLDFSELNSQSFMSAPTAVKVNVDHRYGNVDYFQRESGLCFTEDGGWVLFDGYGGQISSTGGSIRIDCPGDIMLAPGRSLVSLAGDDVVLRAYNSMDLTAGRRDLRLKAENNLQILGGNEQGGGVLIESKSPGFVADFEDKSGEEVQSGGIMFKAANAAVVTWAGDIYMRTGGSHLGPGNIVLDAGKGKDSVVIKGDSIINYAKEVIGLYIGPDDQNSNVTAVHEFAATGAIIDKGVLVGGFVEALGNALFDGEVICKDGYLTLNNSGTVFKVRADDYDRAVADAKKNLPTATQQAQDFHNAVFFDDLYQSGNMGDDATILQVGFSYRDDGEGVQYGTTSFALLESRWQAMARRGDASGGAAWTEPVVNYQGHQQLPYPGKINWTDQSTLLQLTQLNLYDAAAGRDKDRANGTYESPTLSGFNAVAPATGFKVLST